MGQLLVNNPIGNVLTFSISTSSSLRVLFLMGESFGALALGTFLSGGQGRKKRGGSLGAIDSTSTDPCDMKDAAEVLGKLIIVGLVSALFAVMPMVLVSRFHSREFIQLD